MRVSFENRNLYLIPVSMALAVLSVLILPNTLFILLSAIVFGLIYYYGKNVLLIIILLNYLTSLTEYVGNLRIVLNIIASIALIYLFLQEYGLKFSEYPKIPKAIVGFVLFLFANLIVSTLCSDYLFDGISAIITMGIFLLICYMFYGLIKDIHTIRLYILGIILSFIAISIRMFYDVFTLGMQSFFLRSILEIKDQLSGNLGYTHITIFFISLTFISAYLIIKYNPKKVDIALIILFIINIITLIFANARAAIVAAILSNLILFALVKAKTLLRSMLIIIPTFLGLYLFIPAIESIVDLYLRIDTINQRDLFWQSGVDVISQNPILGVGPRAFHHYFFTYAPSYVSDFLAMDLWSYRPTPHNLFLMFWAETGISGVLVIIFLFVLLFYYSIRCLVISKKTHFEYFVISAAVLGLGCGLFFRSFFEISGILHYGFITTDLPFWLIFIIILKINQFAQG
jgi:O-antigen ligase